MAALSSLISWSLDRLSSWVLLNHSSVKALSAKIWIVSSSGTLVNKEVTSWDSYYVTSLFDCLIKEMLFIRKLKPSLNVQADSIRAKVFT